LTFGLNAFSQQLPLDVGTAVNGFQDDFDGTTLNSNWVVAGVNVFSVSGGLLHVNSATGDPNHLLYELPGYNDSIQEVLARIRVLSYGAGDLVRGGVGVGVNPSTTQGINYLFRENTSDGETALHLAFLNDLVAWGPVQNFIWQTNTWYWMRLRQEPNAPSLGGVNDVFGKIWLGDGTQAEPASWQLTWDYTPGEAERTGFAGITASSGGAFQFDVDYILIKASGLPTIVVAPNAFVQVPAAITNEPQSEAVLELLPASFTVGASGNPAPSYQWFMDGTALGGATNATYTLNSVAYADNGASFQVVVQNVVSNVTYASTSSLAILTVIPDTNPPVLLGARSLGLSQVQVTLSKPITPASATNAANYGLSGTNGAVAISNAALEPGSTNVLLGVGTLSEGQVYTLTVNNLVAQTLAAKVIAPDSQTTFFASILSPVAIGTPPPAGGFFPVAGGLGVDSAGMDIGGLNDSFQFGCQQLTGDFDLSVHLADLALSDAFAKAGIMARETLLPGSRFAAALATPSMVGSVFEWRDPASTRANVTGRFPVNYPNTWLRLKRAGNVFSGFGGDDGQSWTALGSATIALPSQVYVGLAVSSHNTNEQTAAQFLTLAEPVTNATVATAASPHEPLGPCSRLTPIAVSEIMYQPAARDDGLNLQFIELYNSNPWFHDLSGYRLAGASLDYTFPAGTVIPGGGFIVVAAAPGDMQSVYGITNALGPYVGALKKSDTIQLLDEAGAVVLTIPYSHLYPWPVAADGTGHSLVLANPTYGEGDPRAWDISDVEGGSPGQMDAFRPSPLRNVVINEILAHSEDPGVPLFIELYNHSNQTNDLSGCILTDDPATNKFVIPAGTLIGPRGFVSFSQSQLGFVLNGAGDTVYFIKPDNSRVLDAVQFEAQADRVSFGRWPDGANAFYPLAALTPGAANSPIWIGDIVINELMYDPISGNDDDQYIELYNKGANTVSLANWQFTSGVSYSFPASAALAPDSYLVIGRNLTNLFAKYPNLNAANTLGNFGGALAHKGERLALAMPQLLSVSGSTGVVTNTIVVVEDEVTYGTGGRWGQWAHGGGSSLELINPNANHRLAYNWADSDETSKSVWTNLEFTGLLDNGANYNNDAVNLVQVGLLDVGECLVDNLEVRPGGTTGTNIVANGDFQAGLTNWTAQGDHQRSSLETALGLGGYQSSQSLHLRSGDGVWTLADNVQGVLTQTTLGAGQTATMRLKARWLRGWPEVLMRLRGNWLEVTGRMPVPENLGTPGLPNSRYTPHPGPAIYEVKHSPPIPPANQPLVVTARFHSINPFQATLLYRIDTVVDPKPTYTSLQMVDDGTGSDALAGDGVYTAAIPAQPAGTVVAFLVQGHDASGATTLFPQDLTNNAGIPRECVVAFGDPIPSGSFSHHHVFITQNWAQQWATGGGVSHETYDGTWVDGGGRIVYNWSGRYAGSPYHQYLGSPVSTLGGMHWDMPADDQVLGTATFDKEHVPGNGPLDDNTIQREQASFWMARQIGLPVLNRRYYFYYVNGNRHGPLMEDTQVPGADMLKEYWPNDNNGPLFKNNAWFEGDVTQQSDGYMDVDNMSFCLLGKFTTTIDGVPDQYKLARYRWMWWIRQYPESANDFSQVYALIDAANTPTNTPAYYANMESQVDTEEWLRLSAAEHATGDLDSFFTLVHWNMYCYKPTMGKWTTLKWDWNITLGAGTSPGWGPDGSQLFTFSTSNPSSYGAFDPLMIAFHDYPPYRRAYLRAFQDIANLAMNNALINPMLDAKYAAFVANGLTTTVYNGLTVTDPAAAGGLESWIGTMHNSLLAAVAGQGMSNVPFAVKSSVVTNDVVVVSGTAPLAVKTVLLNGVQWPLLWNTLSNWTVTVPLQPGGNQFSVVGVDLHGQPVAGASNTTSVVYSGVLPSLAGHVVINEIMYNPAIPGAQYVELYNNSSSLSFDLSGWQLQGLSYTFPTGSLIGPNSFLVLAANRSLFSSAYGGTIPIFDTFNGPLATDGQTLLLVQPGANPAANQWVAGVRYGSGAPWPQGANGTGSSLQLIDPHQDNWRVCNWAGSFPPASASPGKPNTVLASLPAFPPLWLNELQADNLDGITNSAGQHSAWLELYNPGTNVVPLSGLYLSTNYSSLTAWAFPGNAAINPGEFKVIFADARTDLSTTNELHTSFTLPSGSGSLALSRLYNAQPQVLDYIDYTNVAPNHSYGSAPDGQSFDRQEFDSPTPGGPNNAANPISFIAYTSPGWVYTQNFDGLPDPGATSVDSDNPVTINGVTYSLANPYAFAGPVSAGGNSGGLGIGQMAGWYGLGSLVSKFGAADGDQTTGGQISFGPPSSSNRALGLLATASTGATAFGARFINQTPSILTAINVQLTGELWRQSDLPKTLECGYFIEPTGTAPFSTSQTALLPGLNVSFPVNPTAAGGLAVDGTASINQTNLSVVDQAITNWPPGAALWLVWRMTDATGKAQGLAIQNLSFSALAQTPAGVPLTFQTTATNLVLSWMGVAGDAYQVEYKDDLRASAWTSLGDPITGAGAVISSTNGFSLSAHRYYRLRILP
jgi:hypothetical protein